MLRIRLKAKTPTEAAGAQHALQGVLREISEVEHVPTVMMDIQFQFPVGEYFVLKVY